MSPNAKKILFAAIILVFALGILFYSKLNLFKGSLVFFKESPTKQGALQGSFLKGDEAVDALISAALQAKRINSSLAENLKKQYANVAVKPNVTRMEFADLAVRIFQLNGYGYGTRYSDVPLNHSYATQIYILSSNTGLDDYKPGNNATRAYVEKTIQELLDRFSPNPSGSK